MSGQEGLGRHGRAGCRAYIASRDGGEALGSARLGEAFINEMFDRFVLAVAERLSTHIARGNMRDVRMAALALASPVLMAALHQKELQGEEVSPLSSDAFVDHVTSAFIQAYLRELRRLTQAFAARSSDAN
jgi:hypothetical protein